MFLTQVSLTKSFPIELKIPNRTTIAAIEAGERGEVSKTDIKGLKKCLVIYNAINLL
jgi:antitoxin component of RelBE/YafQ-DinJ toxin-antitoxin module